MSSSEVLRLVFAVLAAFMMLVAGWSKVTGQQAMRDAAEQFSIAWPRYRALGFLELAALLGIVLGFWVAALGIVVGVGVVLLTLGAVIFHIRKHDPVQAMVPAILALVFSGAYVAAQTVVAT